MLLGDRRRARSARQASRKKGWGLRCCQIVSTAPLVKSAQTLRYLWIVLLDITMEEAGLW